MVHTLEVNEASELRNEAIEFRANAEEAVEELHVYSPPRVSESEDLQLQNKKPANDLIFRQ